MHISSYEAVKREASVRALEYYLRSQGTVKDPRARMIDGLTLYFTAGPGQQETHGGGVNERF